MLARLEHLQDTFSSNFLGVRIGQGTVAAFLGQMRDRLGDRFDLFAGGQQRRDRGTHHLNVVTTKEYDALSERMGPDRWLRHVEKLSGQEFGVVLLGLGVAESRGNTEYFVVARSEQLAEARRALGLPEKDFAVCLGFYPGEAHGVRKNVLVPIRDPFLKLLGSEYYNNNKTFDFIKGMEHFDGDPQAEVVPVEIGDSTATFRSGRSSYCTVSILGDSLKISARWQGESNRPRLSDTIVSRKLKNT